MSITEELRMYVQDWRDTPSLMDGLDMGDVDGILADFIRIADRIDAEHAEAVADALQLRGEPDRWMELPVDADGVPIHVVDELTNGEDLPARVWALILAGDGWWCKSGAASILVAPSDLRHVQPDSWESIIHDAFVASQEHFGSADAVAELVERCRRLAGECG